MNKVWKSIKKLFQKTNPARILVFTIFALWCLSFLLGFGWLLIASLKDFMDLKDNPIGLPTVWHWENYVKAFEVLGSYDIPFFVMLFNSLWFTFGSVFINIAVVVMAAYALGNFKFFGRNFIVAFIVIVMMIPIYGTGSAALKMYMRLRIYNNPAFLIINASALSGTTLIIMTFFQTLSPAYEEAARMDGAGMVTVFLKIHLPMVVPSVSALVLMGLIGSWNNAETSIYYLPDYPTIAAGLYQFENFGDVRFNKPALYAGYIMCAIPPIVLFSVFRDKVMTSVTIGGIK